MAHLWGGLWTFSQHYNYYKGFLNPASGSILLRKRFNVANLPLKIHYNNWMTSVTASNYMYALVRLFQIKIILQRMCTYYNKQSHTHSFLQAFQAHQDYTNTLRCAELLIFSSVFRAEELTAHMSNTLQEAKIQFISIQLIQWDRVLTKEGQVKPQ